MTSDFSWIFYNFKADKTRIVSVPEQVQVRNTYKTPRSTNNLSSSFGLTEENMDNTRYFDSSILIFCKNKFEKKTI